ncbi:hypothetical protein [Streptosporangium sp. NPDC002524]|uniref:hypothetical protein n=1 Tax=Streptosporangium sp. NPDC002524 TaxID=3154537 RepID=UPI0033192F27
MHGLVVLELFGHLSFVGAGQSEIFRMAMRNLEEDIRQRVPSERKGSLAESVPEDPFAQKDHRGSRRLRQGSADRARGRLAGCPPAGESGDIS